MKLLLTITSLITLHLSSFCQCPLIADFDVNPAVGCSTPHTVFFTDQSTFPDTWHWDFGDGSISTAQNPIYSYTTTGDFIVTLTITDTVIGCLDVFTQMVSVEISNANFSASPTFGCGPLTVNFSDLSTTAATYSWDFGDGSPLNNTQHPTHSYDTPGTYNVSLTITTFNGCMDNITLTNYIQVIGPDVDFSSSIAGQTCGTPLAVNFTDNTLAGSPIVSWSWDFGDGNTSSVQHPSTVYNSTGSYDVSLTVTDLDGCFRTVNYPDYIMIDSIYSIADSGSVCYGDDYTFPDGNTVTNLQADTVYTSALQTVVGMCDSVHVTTVHVNQLNNGVTQNGLTLTASDTAAQYQWLDCDNGFSPIPGAGNQNFVVTSNGNYAVEVTLNGCADTSVCIAIADVGILSPELGNLIIYPNPTTGIVHLDLTNVSFQSTILIRDLTGRVIHEIHPEMAGIIQLEMGGEEGVYLIEVWTENGLMGQQLVVKQ